MMVTAVVTDGRQECRYGFVTFVGGCVQAHANLPEVNERMCA